MQIDWMLPASMILNQLGPEEQHQVRAKAELLRNGWGEFAGSALVVRSGGVDEYWFRANDRFDIVVHPEGDTLIVDDVVNRRQIEALQRARKAS